VVGEMELLRLIDLIYQGALDAGCWAEAIAEVGRAFGGDVSSLSLYERPSRALRYQLELDDESFRQKLRRIGLGTGYGPGVANDGG
jgi:hypothetical protein